MNKEQWQVVEEGISFYNKVSHIIDCGITSYEGPYIESYRKPRGWQAILREKDSNELLIVVNTFGDSDKEIIINIPDEYKIINRYHKEGILINLKDNQLIINNVNEFDGVAIYLKK